MKRVLSAAGMALALGAAPIAAQTRLSVAVGFGTARPYVASVVVVGRPRVYYPSRRFSHRPPRLVVRHIYVARHRHHHRHHDIDCDYDR